jgi:hypothetical protein
VAVEGLSDAVSTDGTRGSRERRLLTTEEAEESEKNKYSFRYFRDSSLIAHARPTFRFSACNAANVSTWS